MAQCPPARSCHALMLLRRRSAEASERAGRVSGASTCSMPRRAPARTARPRPPAASPLRRPAPALRHALQVQRLPAHRRQRAADARQHHPQTPLARLFSVVVLNPPFHRVLRELDREGRRQRHRERLGRLDPPTGRPASAPSASLPWPPPSPSSTLPRPRGNPRPASRCPASLPSTPASGAARLPATTSPQTPPPGLRLHSRARSSPAPGSAPLSA